jgi:thiamine pyrophosphokinase
VEPADSKKRAITVVFAGGSVVATPRLRHRLAALQHAYVVAADSGAATALELGLRPDLVVGDMDSIDLDVLDRLRAAGVPLQEHPREKDATDGELALQCALSSGARALILVGFLGGPRLDQELASILHVAGLQVDATLVDGVNECRLVRPGEPADWRPEPHEIVSVIPVEDASGVRTDGLRWPLTGDRLARGTTRGVSNEPVAERVSVSIETGLVLLTRYFGNTG